MISGSGGISFDAMELLSSNGIDLILVSWKGEVVARLSSPEMRTVETRREQYYAFRDERSGYLAKQILLAKIRNQYATLGTLAKSRMETGPEKAEKLKEKQSVVAYYQSRIEDLDAVPIDKMRENLMGLEGIASQTYWQGISEIIPEEFRFKERSGRYAQDPVNALFNYGYALLEGEVWRAVHYAGLDPYGGFLHVDRPGRPSMVLDLMEEFRQQLVDKTVIALVSKREISPEGFQMEQGVCRMDDAVRKTVLKEVLNRFEDYVRHRDEKRRWTDIILLQARDLAKFLRGESSSYEGFYFRW